MSIAIWARQFPFAFSRMTANIRSEIQSVRNFFRTRSDGNAGNDTSLQKSFADTVIQMINTIKHFGPRDATDILSELKDTPYGDEQTRRISSLIDTLLQNNRSTAQPDAIPTSGNKQTLQHWWHYLTQQDWDVLNDKTVTYSGKVTRVIERGLSFGLVDPEEQTARWALATLVIAHYESMPSASELFKKVDDIKKSWKSEASACAWVYDHIKQFPEYPSGLPGAVYKAAYPDGGDQPVTVLLHGIRTVADSIPLRSNSKLLGKKTHSDAVAAFDEMKAVARSARSSHPQKHITTHHDGASAAPDSAVGISPIIPSMDDQVEMALFYEYQQKITEHRLAKPSPSDLGRAPQRQPGALRIHRATDGHMSVNPEPPKDEPSIKPGQYIKAEPHIKSEPHTTAEPHIKEEPPAAPPVDNQPPNSAKLQPIGFDDLDPYARAAIDALANRKARKKAEAKDAKDKQHAAGAARKRPAAASGDDEGRDTCGAPVGKKPAAAGKGGITVKTDTHPIRPLSRSQIMKAMPKKLPQDGSNPPPVAYKGGIIYTSVASKRFRALQDRTDVLTEKSRAWGSDKPTQHSWEAAVAAIDAKKT